MKKAPRETQTLHAGCSKAEPKIFAPPQTPFLGVQDGQILISWRRSLPSPTNPVWWGSMHAISSDCVDTHTHTHIHTHTPPNHKHTHRQDRLQYTAPQLARRVISILPTNRRHSFSTCLHQSWTNPSFLHTDTV